MLDIHSHILPKMDDGSKSVEMSLEMLRATQRQGVDTIVATSHFYADAESPDDFLRRRAHAIKKLRAQLPADSPEILLGAEVLYYPGISHSAELARLAIEGTSLILIEMPFSNWGERIFDELHTFESNFGLRVILAHVERYQGIQKRAIFNALLDDSFLIQCNASAFLSMRSRRLALNLLDHDKLRFLGSDCHNTTTRPQQMKDARGMILKKRGEDVWQQFDRNSYSIFRQYQK